MINGGTALIDDYPLTLSNLDKVLWPESGVTKGELINYFLSVSEFILPHLQDRPLVLTRYPNGAGGKWFYQKNLPGEAPEWLETWPDNHSGRIINYLICLKRADLAWLGNQAAIEIHSWYSKRQDPDHPDQAVIDLDPGTRTDFDDAREIAFAFRELFSNLGLECYPKTSGATGLHLYLPLRPGRHTYPEVVAFMRRCCEMVAEVFPDRTTVARRVEDRQGKVYLDYLQNGRGKTLVSVYSPRPKPQAPVSCPVTWAELEHCLPDWFTIRTVPERLKVSGDLLAPLLGPGQDLGFPAKMIGLDNV